MLWKIEVFFVDKYKCIEVARQDDATKLLTHLCGVVNISTFDGRCKITSNKNVSKYEIFNILNHLNDVNFIKKELNPSLKGMSVMFMVYITMHMIMTNN